MSVKSVHPKLLIQSTLLLLASLLFTAGCSSIQETQRPPTNPTTELPYFTDATTEAGIDFTHGAFRWGMSGDPVAMMGGGVCWLDYNNDGWLDLFAVNSYSLDEAGRWQSGEGLPTSALFRNQSGIFDDISVQAGVAVPMRGNGCTATDLNQDGWTDIYVTTERVNLLFWNNGDGTFTEGGAEAGLDVYGWQTSASIGDLNGDYLPDIFLAGYVDINTKKPGSASGFPGSHFGRPDLLFVNNGIGPGGRSSFREVGLSAGLLNSDYEYGLGSILSDFDLDGDLDIFIANDTNPNRLYENVPYPGGIEEDPLGLGFRLAEVGQFAKIDDRNSGMGVATSDYDNNGHSDLVVTNMGYQLHSVYNNIAGVGRPLFEDATNNIGVDEIGVGWTGWGISWADVDLDSDQDLIIANGSIPVLDPTEDVQKLQLFSNLTAQGLPGQFQDLTDIAGFNEIPPQLGRGSAVADYDNDGDLDVAVNSIGSRLLILENQHRGNNWVAVNLVPATPGTRVTAQLSDGTKLGCEIQAGSSYLSSEDPRCYFGLGQMDGIINLSVIWPNGAESHISDVSANQLVEVLEPLAIPSGDEVDLGALGTYFFELALLRGGAVQMEVLPRPSEELVRLGEALFWDRLLSGPKDVSCATCHHPTAGTGDGLSLSVGVGGEGLGPDRQLGQGHEFIPRNATEIFNRGVAGWEVLFWDGRVSGIPENDFLSPAGDQLPNNLDNLMAVQAMFPVTSRDEMRGAEGSLDVEGQPNALGKFKDTDFKGIWEAIMERLLEVPDYQELFTVAYPDINLNWLGFEHAANAIAAYQMATFTFTDSPWDNFLAGDEAALSTEGRLGAELFFGKAGCSACHNGPLLSDQNFYNIGVPQLGPGKEEDAPFDTGRQRISHSLEDQYAFRTPPLRNVALTGPWMHNGAYTSLEDAVRHHLDVVDSFADYNPHQLSPELAQSVQETTHLLTSLSPEITHKIRLNEEEIKVLMAFLHQLTSPSAAELCNLIPESVPSGLPLDRDPNMGCPQ